VSIKILAVGKKHEAWIIDGVERYQKRLKKPFDIKWVILPHSPNNGLRARQDDSKAINMRLTPSDYVILLDEKGENINSPSLSRLLLSEIESSKKVTIIIGGAYGVDNTIRERANFVWSLSNLVFPHQLVRLMLVEQIYRAQEIAGNRSYHHE